MYAIIQVGSYQYKVEEGTRFEAERLDLEQGKTYSPDKVLAYVNDSDVRIGQPYLKDIKVTAEVVAQIRDAKKISYVYRKRKDSATTKGHRQYLTVLSVKSIAAK